MSLDLDIIVAGPSESRMIAAELMNQLRCPNIPVHKDTQCTGHPYWRRDRNATFLSECRQGMPVVSATCVNRTRLVWAWESYANIDPRLERWANTTKGHRRHVLFYSVGGHYFSQFPDFQSSMLWQETVERPQEWLNQYFMDMSRLMQWMQHWRDSYGCVIWKTIPTFQPRHGDVNQSVHPSRANAGIHAMINKWSIAMATAAGIPVLDVQPHTIWESTVKPLHDFYHDYDFMWQAQELLRAIAAHGC